VLILDNEKDFLLCSFIVSFLVCDSQINLFFYLYNFNSESEYRFAFSLLAVTAVKEAVMDILSWDGTLSSGDFRLAACAFMEKWKSVMSASPPWSWVPCPKQPGGASHDVSVVNHFLSLPLLQSVRFQHLMLFYFAYLFLSLSLRWKDTYHWRT
jgi:hypothetical protein